MENKSKQSSMPNLEHLLNLFGGGTSAADGAEQIHERTQIMKRPRLQQRRDLSSSSDTNDRVASDNHQEGKDQHSSQSPRPRQL